MIIEDVPVPWLGKKLIQEAENMKAADEKMYDWLWLGLCTGLDELVYYMFDEKKHVKEVTEEDLRNIRFIVCGVDYGQMNATTYQFFGMDFKNKCIRGIDEFTIRGVKLVDKNLLVSMLWNSKKRKMRLKQVQARKFYMFI